LFHEKGLSAEKKTTYVEEFFFKEASVAGNCHRFEKRIGSGSLKPSTNRMLNRIKCIYMFIHKNGTVTTQELVEEFGITPRTIQRDLNVLAYNDLVISPSRGKWTTTQKKVKLTS
jgi:predicted HTH transcriptional regulator